MIKYNKEKFKTKIFINKYRILCKIKEVICNENINIPTFLSTSYIYIIMNKTTFGFELKACGLNKNAGIYAGIKAKRNMVLSMVIAGALAGNNLKVENIIPEHVESLTLKLKEIGVPISEIRNLHNEN